MTAESYRSALMDTAYLAACAVNGSVPDAARVSGMDPDAVLAAAEKHNLDGIAAMALESAGIRTEATVRARGNAIRKVILLDAEKNAILARFEEAGIWYLPLKGTLLKDLYPAVGMRQMSDIDILIDPERADEADGVMAELGYEKVDDGAVHNVFHKAPLVNIELHKQLFLLSREEKLSQYYDTVRQRLIPDKDRHFGFHFSDEDFYIYITAHEFKHYVLGGTGLRSLLDTYVYCKAKGDSLNWAYIHEEAEKMEMAGFEEQNRELAFALFSGQEINASQQEMLDYMVFSGTYGTIKNRVANDVARFGDGLRGKLRYFFSRAFLSREAVKTHFPLFAKVPILLPFLPLYRLVKGLTQNGKRVKSEIRALAGHKQNKSDARPELKAQVREKDKQDKS